MDEKPYKGFVIWHLLWSNLGVRPLRSALSVLALSLQVFLVLLIVGLTSGALADWRTRAEGVGAETDGDEHADKDEIGDQHRPQPGRARH